MADFEAMKAGSTPHERMTLMLMERIEQLEDRLEEETRKTSEAVAQLQTLKPTQKKKQQQQKKPPPNKRPPAGYPEPEYVCDGVYRVYSPEDGSWKWLSEQ